MFSILKLIFIVLIIVGVFFLVWGITHNSNITGGSQSTQELKTLGAFKACRNAFDCELGFVCEVRNHPSIGICVIAPGGACHKNSSRDDICYSGYYCDAQDGTCLRK
jgi:hypothetical protein